MRRTTLTLTPQRGAARVRHSFNDADGPLSSEILSSAADSGQRSGTSPHNSSSAPPEGLISLDDFCSRRASGLWPPLRWSH